MITTELGYLAWAAAFTGLMWMPYILNLIAVRGPNSCRWLPSRPKAIGSMGGTDETGSRQCD